MEGTKIPYKMLSLDPFSQWLGIEILACEIGNCKVGMTIRKEMLNSMGKAHGGIAYSLADTAFGFSANTPFQSIRQSIISKHWRKAIIS